MAAYANTKLSAEEKALRATARRRVKLNRLIGKHTSAIAAAMKKIDEIDAAATHKRPSEFVPVCYEPEPTTGRKRPSDLKAVCGQPNE